MARPSLRINGLSSGKSEMTEKYRTMSNASKRIPVTEERWRELNEIKEAGETYDDLLAELIQEHQRRQLAERTREVRDADSEELTSLDEL